LKPTPKAYLILNKLFFPSISQQLKHQHWHRLRRQFVYSSNVTSSIVSCLGWGFGGEEGRAGCLLFATTTLTL